MATKIFTVSSLTSGVTKYSPARIAALQHAEQIHC